MRVVQDNIMLKEVSITSTLRLRIANVMMIHDVTHDVIKVDQ